MSLHRSLGWIGLGLLLASRGAAVEPGFKVCANTFPLTPLQRILLATNAGSALLSDITAEGYVDAAALEAGTTWDFSALAGDDRVLQIAPVDAAWSCSVGGSAACRPRFALADLLLVQDNYPGPTRDVNALEYDGGQNLYLRAQVGSEGAGGEVRVCFQSDVRFVRFEQPGDCAGEGDTPWSTPLACDRSATQDDGCGTAAPQAGLDGALSGRAVRNGTMTLPSGHIVDAVLVETYADFEIIGLFFNNCVVPAGALQQYLLMWLIPHYGPIAQLSSPAGATDLSWQSAGSTTIGYGLLPPLCAQVEAVTTDSVTVSWVPGRTPGAFAPDGFVVHWGTTPGMPTTSTDDLPVTIPGTQTSFTVTGLLPATSYCFSVTTRMDYTDPVSGVTTTYDSIALPATIGADIDGDTVRDTSYPPEVCVTTGGPVPPPACAPALPGLWRDDTWRPGTPVGSILPLDIGDEYLPGFTSGGTDPEPVLTDPGRPLIFYAIPSSGPIQLTKSGMTVRIDF